MEGFSLRVAFYTLGCKVNQYETAALKEQFSHRGYEVVESGGEADLYVVNSCTVTAEGDKKSRQALRRFRRQSPLAKIALTGCFPQAFPEEAQIIPEADIVVGSSNRSALVELAEQAFLTGERIVSILPHAPGTPFEPLSAGEFTGRTRALLKIQDGCRRFCSYCIIPTARGPLRSMPPAQMREQLAQLAASGYREVVLAGINLPCYGVELGLTLLDAVTLACETPGLDRVRLGSLEPELLTPEAMEAMSRLESLCPQFHLSLQSGCDATLARMRRQYDTAEYRRIVEQLRRSFPGCAITTDIMVGFPGETDAEFEQTLAFAREIQLAQAHIFTYSRREGTAAASYPGQVPQSVKNHRSHLLSEVTNASASAFLQAQVGTIQPVLFENPHTPGRQPGHTPNYTLVTVPHGETLARRILPVHITAVEGQGCMGELVSPP
ncbi:tRNA (N(6)-L-threonylcarbamoyladenosine(37)-C(2))-methylthiotransferase MtaB [Oscillospiraceae bacterium MB08-C2-2]|nr:tRNA (N(6)-L-threonylcarbamoyladenosine(37)-C(2))-methylthiotransferase MtaB [Oscillospiraceae bacterium MB08-C2-2]